MWKRKLPLKPWRGTLNPSPSLKTIPIVQRRLWPDRLRVDDHYLHALELSEPSEQGSVSLSTFGTCNTGLEKEYHIPRREKGRRTGLRCLNPHLVPKDAINAFDLRPHKNKLRNKPRGFPGSTGPPGFCSTKQQMSNLYYGNRYTFLQNSKN